MKVGLKSSLKNEHALGKIAVLDEPRGYYMLNKIIQIEKENTALSHLYMKSKKVQFMETESRMVDSSGGEVGTMGRCWPKGTKL